MRLPLLIISATLICSAAFCGEEIPSAFLEQHCVKCHGPDEQKGDYRIDTLAAPSEATEDDWTLVAELIESGEMPPRKEPRPAAEDKAMVVDWISQQLAQTAKPNPSLRRMNRAEFEYTLQDILGIETSLANLLPADSSYQGFDNVADGLGISAVHLESYLEAVDVALDDMIRRVKPLTAHPKRAYPMQVAMNTEVIAAGNTDYAVTKGGAFVDLTLDWPFTRVDPVNPTEPGVYRCRAAIFPHNQAKGRTISVAVYTGPQYAMGERQLQGVYDVTGNVNNPRIIEFEAKLNVKDTLHIIPWIYPAHVVGRDGYGNQPGVGVKWAETYGPIDQAYPSKPTKKLFGDSITMTKGKPIYMEFRKGMRRGHLDSANPKKDADRIIRDFVAKAVRRPLEKSITDQFVNLALSQLEADIPFEESVRAGISAVLCSPHFLLHNVNKEVDNYTIASRMAYFLWSSMPDEELFKAAEMGQLSFPKERAKQVERMLNDPKIERFVERFTGQWLDMHEIKFTLPDSNLFPEYDDLLLHSMLKETHGFFRHILDENLSVRNFVDSDFACLNQRMAEHYGIEGVFGHQYFRIIDLPKDSIRGGLLAQASVLKVTANGTGTSPVTRGVWVLDNLLGQPPSPPPGGIGSVEPDIRGANNIRERLAKHRETESCSRCHSRIDPPGFALEEFNAIGLEREFYRSLGEGEELEGIDTYRKGLQVSSHDIWQDGTKFSNFVEFRKQLLTKEDVVARAIATKLLIYGTGMPVTKANKAIVDEVVAKAKKDDYGLRSMIHAVVESELFHRN